MEKTCGFVLYNAGGAPEVLLVLVSDRNVMTIYEPFQIGMS